ncbi:MAG: hypothetical protein AB7K09_04390 [Planctomycetota bacterium]
MSRQQPEEDVSMRRLAVLWGWIVVPALAMWLVACGPPRPTAANDNARTASNATHDNTNSNDNTHVPTANENRGNTPANTAGPTGPAGPAGVAQPKVGIRLPATIEAWQLVDATIHITNVADVPLMLIEVDVRTRNSQPVLQRSFRQQRPAVALPDGGLGVRAAWLEEDPGTAARGPNPPVWQWHGEQLLCTAPVLAPGESCDLAAPFRAEYEIGDRLACRLSVVPLLNRGWLLRATAPRLRTERRGVGDALTWQPGAPRWYETAQLEIDYVPLGDSAIAAGAAARMPVDLSAAPADDREKMTANNALDLHIIGATRHDFEAHTPGQVMAAAALTINHCKPDIDAARLLCGVTRGPYSRAVDAQQWVVIDAEGNEGKGISWLVGADHPDARRLDGNALNLVRGLNDDGAQRVELFRGAPDDDPGGMLAWFQAAGFEVERHVEPDGNWIGLVVVQPAALLDFALGMRDLGLRLEGLRAFPFR